VLRAGRTVATVKPADVTSRELAELMVGSELPTPETRGATVTDQVRLSVAGLTVSEEDRVVVDDVNLEIRCGEIVGVAGVEGNGQGALVEALLGIRHPAAGTIELDGTDITDWSVRRRRERGVGYIPEDRHRRGLLAPSPLWENTMLGHQTMPPFTRGIWVNRSGARAKTRAVIEEYDVRTPGPDVPGLALSGGNQQKLIVGREMSAEPRLLVAAHPTRGIDVGAQAAVWDQLRTARAAGLAVLLISADLDELIGLSDRLVVILRGRLVAELDPQRVTAEELGSYMTGAHPEPARG
jgi:general nucleoside transport system ATP-binding protein